MSVATLIYPHQLFTPGKHPALAPDRIVYIVEEPLFFTFNPAHRQRLLLHRLSMRAYRAELSSAGYEVHYLEITDLEYSAAVFDRLVTDGITDVHIVDTTDDFLEKEIKGAQQALGLSIVRYDSPLFILSKEEACERFEDSNQHLAHFYKKLRTDKNILIDSDKKPMGGQWSFDADNRKKLPKKVALPADIATYEDDEIAKAWEWLKSFESERYGEATVWVPYTRSEAEKFLQEFLRLRFHNFGPYEDAITTEHVRVFHSTLSPLLNIGLLTPKHVLDEAIAYAERHSVPINSLEGFIRQILGWREFIRASYEVDGRTMRTSNFFNHSRTLPEDFWTGATGVAPVDHTIATALQYGYTHHIERLMVMGNFMLLSHTDPDEVYRWFMGMYVDAYDWVMVPNVYAMSQFADGGSFATKPYISGSNYLKKMSDYTKGNWEEIWTALYWNFINEHLEFFKANPRLAMMPRMWEKMDEDTKNRHLATAQEYLEE